LGNSKRSDRSKPVLGEAPMVSKHPTSNVYDGKVLRCKSKCRIPHQIILVWTLETKGQKPKAAASGTGLRCVLRVEVRMVELHILDERDREMKRRRIPKGRRKHHEGEACTRGRKQQQEYAPPHPIYIFVSLTMRM
jgi:hypothetical protein